MAAVEAVDPAPTAPEDVEMAVAEAGTSETNGAAANSGDTRAGTDDPEKAKALNQIEFYFADSNLPYDKFMWTLHSANAEHWVPIATVASFKRMRQYQPKGVPWLADALRQSESLLEVDEMGTKVRRREEVREPKDQFERSVYAKGFGEETPTLQVELEAFFSKYGKVNAVRMRRMEGQKGFKGSVFCEFANFEDVEKFLEADPKPQWNGNDLLIMSKDAYCEMKIKEKGLTGRAARTKRATIATRGFNAFKMDDKTKEMLKKQPEIQEGPEIYLEFMGTRLRVNQKDGGSVVEADVPFTKGASLRFSGCGGGFIFTDIKASLKERFKKPPYIQHKRGADSGIIGFDKTLSDEDIIFVREHLNTLNGNSVTWEIPDEDSEKEFQIERAQAAARRVISGEGEGSSERGRGGRGKWGGRGGRERGGRGGGGGRGGRRGDFGSSREAKEEIADQLGEKRKRAVEPDGGPDTKGQGVPVVHTTKKAKTDMKETGDGDS